MKQSGITVAALIKNEEGKVLMLQHKKHKDIWNLPGGKVEDGDAPRDTLQRELKEELGIDIVIIGLIGFREKYWENDGMHWLDLIYECKIKEGKEPTLCEPDKHSALDWKERKSIVGNPKFLSQNKTKQTEPKESEAQ